MPPNGHWRDLIDLVMEFTEDAMSPELFRRWGAIALVAGAMERRVWTRTKAGEVFPNLYTLLVAPPGVGKQIIDIIGMLWMQTKELGTETDAFQGGRNFRISHEVFPDEAGSIVFDHHDHGSLI